MGRMVPGFDLEKCRKTLHPVERISPNGKRYTLWFCEGILGPLSPDQLKLVKGGGY